MLFYNIIILLFFNFIILHQLFPLFWLQIKSSLVLYKKKFCVFFYLVMLHISIHLSIQNKHFHFIGMTIRKISSLQFSKSESVWQVYLMGPLSPLYDVVSVIQNFLSDVLHDLYAQLQHHHPCSAVS